MARPTLWRYGDAGNLDPKRTVPLLAHEWMSCMMLREGMEYDLPTDKVPFRVRDKDDEPEVNRIAGDHAAPVCHSILSERAPPFSCRFPLVWRHEVG